MDAKKAFRAEAIRRQRGSKGYSYALSKTLQDRIYNLIIETKPKRVMLYISLTSEVETFGIIKKLRQRGIEVWVPFMEGASFKLVQYRLPLEKKQWGIKEPKNSNKYKKQIIDIAIVPVVGIDGNLRRIGYGKGMYDRFFEHNSYRIKRVYFVSKFPCYTSRVLTQSHDISAQGWITSS